MAEPLVIIEDLHKSFVHMGHELEVLRGIDLTIDRGEVMAIVGTSGAGKSTLLHCIGTLDLPTSGSILLNGHELVGLSGAKLAEIRNETIGFVFQFHHLLPEFNALENVMMPGMIQGRSRSEMEKLARELLDEVGLGDRITHRPGELSGGEQQRVALARALVLSPKLILADEPTGNLDSTTSDAIHKLFFDINKKHGTTIVVVTHNKEFAQQMPRRVRMLDGRIESDDGASAVPSDTPSRRAARLERATRRRAREKAKPGEFWIRFGAQAIDWLVMHWLGAVVGVLAALVLLGWWMPSYAIAAPESIVDRLILVPGGLLALLAYHAVSEKIGGATLGKVLCGLRVRSEELGSCSWGGAFIRNLVLLFVDGLLLGLVGYMAMSGSPTGQRIGDRWGSTVVVHSSSLPDGSRPSWMITLLGVVAGSLCCAIIMMINVLLYYRYLAGGP